MNDHMKDALNDELNDETKEPGYGSSYEEAAGENGTPHALRIVSISLYHQVNTLTLSDGSALRLPHALFAQLPWRQGDKIDLDKYEFWLSQNEYSSCMERAGHTLSVRNRTEKEIRDTLLDAGYRESCIDRVIERLKEVGYVDDTAYATVYVKNRMDSGYGEKRIRQELRMKGIDDLTIQSAFESEAASRVDPLISLREAARKAVRGKDLSNFRIRHKVKVSLARRGFDFEDIDTVLSEYADVPDDDYPYWNY